VFVSDLIALEPHGCETAELLDVLGLPMRLINGRLLTYNGGAVDRANLVANAQSAFSAYVPFRDERDSAPCRRPSRQPGANKLRQPSDPRMTDRS
jgi:hypothetical protein